MAIKVWVKYGIERIHMCVRSPEIRKPCFIQSETGFLNVIYSLLRFNFHIRFHRLTSTNKIPVAMGIVHSGNTWPEFTQSNIV